MTAVLSDSTNATLALTLPWSRCSPNRHWASLHSGGSRCADLRLVCTHITGGTRPRSIFRNIDYQQVTKRSVETQPKKVYVSTLHLKRYLITNQLHFTPWPRPATYPAIYPAIYLATYLATYPATYLRYLMKNRQISSQVSMSASAQLCFPPTTSYSRTSISGPPFQAGSPPQ